MATRRRILKYLFATTTAGTAGGVAWSKWGPRKANTYYDGPVSDHFDGQRFFNPGGGGPGSLGQLVKFKAMERAALWPDTFASPFADAPAPPRRVIGDEVRVAYIGHASFLVQTGGLNILLDPVYAERASPVSFAGPKRVNPPGIGFDALPPIDVVLVTHNHYDHLDTATLGRLHARFRPRVVTPLGNDTVMRDAIADIRCERHDWGAAVALAPGVTVHVVPTHHWSARGLRDRRHALWASFVVASGDKRIYCVGDSGFGGGSTFRAVAARHPRIDLALLPIGAYEPRWFMGKQHMNPDEAVEAMVMAGARRAVGHHWGTFQLTSEPIDLPPADLAQALARRSLPAERFLALRPGQVIAA